MKTTLWMVGLALVVLLGVPMSARGDVYTVAPVEAVVLPGAGGGPVQVAFRFDLSGLRSGENRRIDEALLDWWLTGMSKETVSAFSAYAVTGTWSEASVEGGAAPVLEENSASGWDVFPASPELDGRKLARLDLTELVNAWATGAKANYGVVVATTDMSREALLGQLARAKLTVRYGFRGN